MRIAIAGATGLIGAPLVAAARAAGHDVVELSRGQGVDLVSGAGLTLDGVDAVIDVTNTPDLEREAAIAFFSTVARHLADAGAAAGVQRTVLLSIIGVDRTAADDGYMAGKDAQERATTAAAPGARVLRAAQFHEFADQMLGWTRDGDTAAIPDQPIQPVAIGVVVDALLALATGADDRPLLEIAGPRPERLPELVERLVAHRGEAVTITAAPVSPAVADGALRPGPGATIAGPDFAAWLATAG